MLLTAISAPNVCQVFTSVKSPPSSLGHLLLADTLGFSFVGSKSFFLFSFAFSRSKKKNTTEFMPFSYKAISCSGECFRFFFVSTCISNCNLSCNINFAGLWIILLFVNLYNFIFQYDQLP